MRDDTVYLRHIQESIRRIEENVAQGRDRFLNSHTFQDAVLRNLQTLAESTQRLSEELRQHILKSSGIASQHFVMCLFTIISALMWKESGRLHSVMCLI